MRTNSRDTASEPNALRRARESRKWTQSDLAERLGVSQGYVSLLENGQRRVPPKLRRRLTRVMELSPTHLPVPVAAAPLKGDQVARALGRLGYPGFAHVAAGPRLNPAAVVAGALLSPELDARLADALPWLLERYADLDWQWLVVQAKLNDLQNRLGFLVTLARSRSSASEAQGLLADAEHVLERSRLDRDEPLSSVPMTAAEQRWLEAHRSGAAARWRVLSGLTPEASDNA